MRLILASTSRYRRELLGRLGLPFECIAPEVDETVLAGEALAATAARLAHAKAAVIAARHPDAVVIGSDQVAELDGAALGKPGTRERSRLQLAAASGCAVHFHTGVCVMHAASGGVQQHVDTTVVCFRMLDAAMIERYLDLEPALDCAGGFKCEGLGISLFDAIESHDPTALIGLPLIALVRMLTGFGIDPLR